MIKESYIAPDVKVKELLAREAILVASNNPDPYEIVDLDKE